MTPKRGLPSRMPEAREEKARFLLEHAREDVSAGRLQSAENSLRLAAHLAPNDAELRAFLEGVVQTRSRRPS